MKNGLLILLGAVGLASFGFLVFWPESAPAPTAGSTSSPAKNVPYGLVDFSKLVRRSYLHQAVDEKMEIEMNSIQKEDLTRQGRIEELGQVLQTLVNKINDPSLSLATRDAARRDAQIKEAEIEALKKEREVFLKITNDHLTKKEQILRNEVTREIRDCVQEYAQARELEFVFDVSGNSESNDFAAASGHPVLDLTDAVLEILNKDAPKATESDQAADKDGS